DWASGVYGQCAKKSWSSHSVYLRLSDFDVLYCSFCFGVLFSFAETNLCLLLWLSVFSNYLCAIGLTNYTCHNSKLCASLSLFFKPDFGICTIYLYWFLYFVYTAFACSKNV